MLRVIIMGWFIAITILVGLMALPLYAADCLYPSPTLLSGKGLFDPVVFRDLTPSEHSMVHQALQSLEGRWTGQGIEMLCPSATGEADKKEYKYKIMGKVHTDNDGNLLLKMNFQDIKNRTSHQELFRLYLKEMRLRYDNDTHGDVELVTLTPSRITFIRRLTNTRFSGIYRRKEHVISLQIDAGGFSLHRDSYSGGKMNQKRLFRFEGRY